MREVQRVVELAARTGTGGPRPGSASARARRARRFPGRGTRARPRARARCRPSPGRSPRIPGRRSRMPRARRRPPARRRSRAVKAVRALTRRSRPCGAPALAPHLESGLLRRLADVRPAAPRHDRLDRDLAPLPDQAPPARVSGTFTSLLPPAATENRPRAITTALAAEAGRRAGRRTEEPDRSAAPLHRGRRADDREVDHPRGRAHHVQCGGPGSGPGTSTRRRGAHRRAGGLRPGAAGCLRCPRSRSRRSSPRRRRRRERSRAAAAGPPSPA